MPERIKEPKKAGGGGLLICLAERSAGMEVRRPRVDSPLHRVSLSD